MASSPPNPDSRRPEGRRREGRLTRDRDSDGGFATPAAVVISLAMATIAVAVQARAISGLHASQADYVRTTAELRLDGAQQLVADALVRGALDTPNDTKIAIGGVEVDAQAQPEGAKLALASAAELDDEALAALGAAQPEAVRSGLAQLAANGDADPADLRALASSPRWKQCAPDAISAYGAGRSANVTAPIGAAYAGEVWRTAVRDGWGWTDERVVRITGDMASPVRIIFRSFHRSTAGRVSCPSLKLAPAAV